MRAYLRLVSLAAVAALTTALPATGAKTAFRYEAAQRVIKACVLYVEQTPGAGDYTNSNPYLIEGLRRSDLCPDTWEFENPLADPAVVAGRPNYVVKGNPSYWRVNLTDDTARQLVGFDLIYICAPLVDIPTTMSPTAARPSGSSRRRIPRRLPRRRSSSAPGQRLRLTHAWRSMRRTGFSQSRSGSTPGRCALWATCPIQRPPG